MWMRRQRAHRVSAQKERRGRVKLSRKVRRAAAPNRGVLPARPNCRASALTFLLRRAALRRAAGVTRALGQLLALRMCEFLELLLAHRFRHALRCAFE